MTDRKSETLTLEKLASLPKIDDFIPFSSKRYATSGKKYAAIEKAEITSVDGSKTIAYVAGIFLKSNSLICGDKLSPEGFLTDIYPFSIEYIQNYQPLK